MFQTAKILLHNFSLENVFKLFYYTLFSHMFIPNALANMKSLVRKSKLEAKYLIAELLLSEVFDSFSC